MERKMAREVLPDLLRPGVKLIICGERVGETSAERGHYYARPGNRFWAVLYAVGLTSQRLEPWEDYLLPDRYRIGLTDLVKDRMHRTPRPVSAADRRRLRCRVENYAPRVLAFNGMDGAAAYLDCKKNRLRFGQLAEAIGDTAVFVLPSTSGMNGHWEKANHQGYWEELTGTIRKRRWR